MLNIAKWLILFKDAVTNASPKNVNSMGRGIHPGHDNNISRPSSSFNLMGHS